MGDESCVGLVTRLPRCKDPAPAPACPRHSLVAVAQAGSAQESTAGQPVSQTWGCWAGQSGAGHVN